MGDSDEEYDRNRRREKFTRERRDYQDPGNRSRGRDDWQDADRSGWQNRSRGRDPYGRDYGRRDRYGSPGDRTDLSPPAKRMRGRDWEERGSYSSSGYDSYGSHSHGDHRTGSAASSSVSGPSGRGDATSDNCPTQPPMMLFKQFLHQMDDEVGETVAVKKYNEYKMNFKKKQVKEFFNKHKDEEW